MNRRTAWLICVTLTLVPATIYADESDVWTRSLVIGGHLGLDFATRGGTASNASGINIARRAGFAAGAGLIWRLTHNFSAQTEFGFAVKGERANGAAPSTSSTWYLAYLEIPILLRASVPISDKVESYGYVGPALGILLDADVEYDDGRFFEVNRAVEPIDIGLMFGAGAAVDVGTHGALTFDVRYNLGLRDTVKPSSDGTYLNRAIYLTIGYQTDLSIFSGDR